MIGIITEKPSAKRNFAKALGGERGVYNGEEYIIVSARGHLYELAEPAEIVSSDLVKKYKSWNLEDLPWNNRDFKWKFVPKKDTTKERQILKDVLPKCDEIVIGTDIDQSGEGQLIAYEIISSLKLKNKNISRMYFIDESPKSIVKAFEERKKIANIDLDGEYKKAIYRAKFDYLTMQYSRAATKLSPIDKQLIVCGRLKSFMVFLVTKQFKAYSEYKKVPYYEIKYKDDKGNIYSSEKQTKVQNKEDLDITPYTKCKVKKLDEVLKSKSPDKLLDLATLSSILSSKYKAKEILDTYQKMYEDSIVSYPRTEDTTVTFEQFNELLPLADDIARAIGVDPAVLKHKQPRKTHVKDQGAHGANRPMKAVDPNSLAKYGPSAKDIYILLCRSYLAMLCEDYTYLSISACLEEREDFKTTVTQTKNLGFKVVFDSEKEVSEEQDAMDSLLGVEAESIIQEGFPSRPVQPSMKWLMKQLKIHNVGTGATRASTYSSITDAKNKARLLIENKGKLSVTDAGQVSYLLLQNTYIGSEEITGDLFDTMKKIETGELSGDVELDKFSKVIANDLKIMINNKKENKTMEQLEKMIKQLEKMNNYNVEKKEKYEGVFEPEGKMVSFNKVWGGYAFSDAECESLLRGDVITIHKDGKDLTGSLAECEYNGYKYYGFKLKAGISNYESPDRYSGVFKPEGKNVSFKKIWGGYEFSDVECEKLLNGDTITIDKSGKNYKQIRGGLALQEYNGRTFYGFKAEEFIR